MLEKVKSGLIVSCQALENEPLHSSEIMSRMALAAEYGGACGIRANSVADILAIKSVVDLPVVGIIKRDYEGSNVYITPTRREVVELMKAEPDMIALDATFSQRPNRETLEEIVTFSKAEFPHVQLMADIATLEQAKYAASLGFDCISTTLHGYTTETQGCNNTDKNFEFIRKVISAVDVPVIAEGNIDTPEKAAACINLGCQAVVVGGAITRPQQIARKFSDAIRVSHTGQR